MSDAGGISDEVILELILGYADEVVPDDAEELGGES